MHHWGGHSLSAALGDTEKQMHSKSVANAPETELNTIWRNQAWAAGTPAVI